MLQRIVFVLHHFCAPSSVLDHFFTFSTTWQYIQLYLCHQILYNDEHTVTLSFP